MRYGAWRLNHVLHPVLYGKKRVVFFPNEQSKNLYKHPFSTRCYVYVDDLKPEAKGL